MSLPLYNWSQPQRQSPAALGLIFFKVLKGLGNLFLPLIVVLFFGKKGGVNKWEYLIVFASAFLLIRSVLEYFFYRFYILEGELIIKSGILRKQTISLSLEKIQGVQLEQNLFHKLTGVARMSFDSAGTEKTEVKIDAIQLQKAGALKAFILEQAAAENESASPVTAAPYEFDERKIIQLGMSDLLKLSFSSNHIEAFFILLGFVFSVFQQAKDIVEDRIEQWTEQASGYIVAGSVSMFVFLFVVAFGISVIVSTGRTFFRYFNFFISAREKGFRIYGGLIQVKEKLIPYNKIQFISWKANWIRRRIGIWLLQYHSVGSHAVKENQQVKIPLTQQSFLPPLLNAYHAPLDENAVPGNVISPLYATRKTLFSGVLPAVALAGIFFNWWEFHALWWLLLIPIVYVHVRIFARRFRFFLESNAVQIKKGTWGTQQILLRWDKIQKVTLKQSMYQRKKELASLSLHTAGGVVTLPYVKKEEAIRLMDYALYKAEISGNSWL